MANDNGRNGRDDTPIYATPVPQVRQVASDAPSGFAAGSASPPIPDPIERESTDQLETRMLEAAIDDGTVETAGADPWATIAQKVVEQIAKDEGGDGGGGGRPTKAHVAKHTWIIALVVALFGSGGIFATYKLTEKRSEENEHRIGVIETVVGAIQKDIKEVADVAHGLRKEADSEREKRQKAELESAQKTIDELERKLDARRQRRHRSRDR